MPLCAPCSLSNPPCLVAVGTGLASLLLTGTRRWGRLGSGVTNGIRHAQNGERGEEREDQKEAQQNRGRVREAPWSFAFSCLCTVLSTGSWLPGTLFAAVTKTEIAVLEGKVQSCH